MRFTRFGLLLCLLLLNISVRAQQTQISNTQSPVVKDPVAVSLVTQVLAGAGGIPAIMAIADYTATGNVSYHRAHDEEGTVVVRGSALGDLRIDATLPTGIRSEAISDGQFSWKTEDGAVRQPFVQVPMNPSRLFLPYLQLAPAVNSVGLSLYYNGLVIVDGHSAHDIQLVRILPGLADPDGRIREHGTIDFFIDATTFQLLMMQDFGREHTVRQIRYSDYRLANGVLLPFSISVQGIGTNWQMQLNQFTFNTGLQASDF